MVPARIGLIGFRSAVGIARQIAIRIDRTRAGVLHEYSRIPGQSGAAGIRRADVARDRRFLGRGSGEGGAAARRAGLCRQGADPCRRPRQGRRREGGADDRGCRKGSSAPARLDTRHPPDRAARQAGAPALYRGRIGNRSRVLPLGAGRSGELADRLRGVDRGRHGYREGGEGHAGEDRHRGGRPGDRRDAASRPAHRQCAAAHRRPRQAGRKHGRRSSIRRSSPRT